MALGRNASIRRGAVLSLRPKIPFAPPLMRSRATATITFRSRTALRGARILRPSCLHHPSGRANMKFISGILFGVIFGLIMAIAGVAIGAVVMPVRALLRRI